MIIGKTLKETNEIIKNLSFKERVDFLIKNKISAVHKLNSGELGIGSRKKGLVLYDLDSKKADYMSENESLQNNNIKSIEYDESSNLWLALNRGISKIRLKPKISQIPVKMISNSLMSYENKLYIAGFRGLYELNKKDFIVSKNKIKTFGSSFRYPVRRNMGTRN